MLDMSLLGVAVMFGIVSIILALVVIRLPVYCQIWSLIGQQLVMWIGLAEAWLRWDKAMLAQHVVVDIGVMCLAAFPGLILLDYLQRKERISYWEKGNYPDELADKDLHIDIWTGVIVVLWIIASYAERIYYLRQACVRYYSHIVNRLCNLGGPFS